jgi:hypothetical protein
MCSCFDGYSLDEDEITCSGNLNVLLILCHIKMFLIVCKVFVNKTEAIIMNVCLLSTGTTENKGSKRYKL